MMYRIEVPATVCFTIYVEGDADEAAVAAAAESVKLKLIDGMNATPDSETTSRHEDEDLDMRAYFGESGKPEVLDAWQSKAEADAESLNDLS